MLCSTVFFDAVYDAAAGRIRHGGYVLGDLCSLFIRPRQRSYSLVLKGQGFFDFIMDEQEEVGFRHGQSAVCGPFLKTVQH